MEAFCRHRARVEVDQSELWLARASAFCRMAAAKSEPKIRSLEAEKSYDRSENKIRE
jgi:hypothetical protein